MPTADVQVKHEAIRRAAKQLDRFELSAAGRQNKTAFVRAAASGFSMLAASACDACLPALDPSKAAQVAESRHSGARVRRAQDLLGKRPELSRLPALLEQYMKNWPAQEEEDRALFSFVSSGVICSAQAWVPDDHVALETVRATPHFHQRPWFDCVRVAMDGGAYCYAQVRLLFIYLGQPLVFIRWLDVVLNPPQSDVLAQRCGCLRLTWETQRGQPNYQVLHLHSIVGVEFVVPDFVAPLGADGEPQFFHTCPTKFPPRRPARLQ